MMTFFSDKDLHKTRMALFQRMLKETKGWSHLFSDGQDGYQQWLLGAVGEGISVALNHIDKFDPSKSNLTHWCYLKVRKIAYRDLQREEKYFQLRKILAQEEPVIEETDPFAHILLSGELFEVLEELSPPQVQALSLVYLIGFPPEQAAQIMKKQRNALDALIFRAKQKAREVYRRKMSPPANEPDPRAPGRDAHMPRPRSSLPDPDEGESGSCVLDDA